MEPIAIPFDAVRTAGFRNEVWMKDGILYVVMKHGHVTIVDDAPVARELLTEHTFCLQFRRYAATWIHEAQRMVALHRILLGLKPTRINGIAYHVDHINGVELDNRLVNLRYVKQTVNVTNRHGLSKANKTGITGVSWEPVHKAYTAYWNKDGKMERKRFPVCKLGSVEAAFEAAKKCREEGIKAIPTYCEALGL